MEAIAFLSDNLAYPLTLGEVRERRLRRFGGATPLSKAELPTAPPSVRPPRRSLTLIDAVSHLDCRAVVGSHSTFRMPLCGSLRALESCR